MDKSGSITRLCPLRVMLHLKITVFLKMCFWLHWVFVAGLRLSLAAASVGLLSSCGVWASCGGGFFCCRAPALGRVGFSGSNAWA